MSLMAGQTLADPRWNGQVSWRYRTVSPPGTQGSTSSQSLYLTASDFFLFRSQGTLNLYLSRATDSYSRTPTLRPRVDLSLAGSFYNLRATFSPYRVNLARGARLDSRDSNLYLTFSPRGIPPVFVTWVGSTRRGGSLTTPVDWRSSYRAIGTVLQNSWGSLRFGRNDQTVSDRINPSQNQRFRTIDGAATFSGLLPLTTSASASLDGYVGEREGQGSKTKTDATGLAISLSNQPQQWMDLSASAVSRLSHSRDSGPRQRVLDQSRAMGIQVRPVGFLRGAATFGVRNYETAGVGRRTQFATSTAGLEGPLREGIVGRGSITRTLYWERSALQYRTDTYYLSSEMTPYSGIALRGDLNITHATTPAPGATQAGQYQVGRTAYLSLNPTTQLSMSVNYTANSTSSRFALNLVSSSFLNAFASYRFRRGWSASVGYLGTSLGSPLLPVDRQLTSTLSFRLHNRVDGSFSYARRAPGQTRLALWARPREFDDNLGVSAYVNLERNLRVRVDYSAAHLQRQDATSSLNLEVIQSF